MFSSSAAIYPPRQPRHRHQRRLLLDSMILLRLLLLQPSTFPAGFPTKPRSDPPHIPVPALRSRDGAAAAGSCLALASVTWQGAPPIPKTSGTGRQGSVPIPASGLWAGIFCRSWGNSCYQANVSLRSAAKLNSPSNQGVTTFPFFQGSS